MPMSCKICKNPNKEAINTAIAQGRALRDIALLADVTAPSVQRHLEKCLRMTVSAYVERRKEEGGVNVVKEFESLLQRGKSAIQAAEEPLTVDGRLNFNPRSWEVEVVYEEHIGDKSFTKTAELCDLLDQIQGQSGKIPQHTYVKVQDLRKTYGDLLGRTESLLDKFAKLGGLYTQDQPNPASEQTKKINAAIIRFAEERGISVERATDLYLNHYGHDILPEVKEKLVSERVM